jgi:hypothetical protein
VPSSNAFSKEWGHEQKYHEVLSKGQDLVLDNGPNIKDKPGNWNWYVGTSKLLQRGLRLDGIHENRPDLLRVEMDVEYGRMYSGLRKVKRRRRIKQRDRMIEGTTKMELDAKEGRGYSSGIQMPESEERKRKKKKARKRSRTTIIVCVWWRTDASVEAMTTSESHHRDTRGRGLQRWKWPKIVRREWAKMLFLKSVKRTRLILLQNVVLRRLLRKGNENLEIVKNTYSLLGGTRIYDMHENPNVPWQREL